VISDLLDKDKNNNLKNVFLLTGYFVAWQSKIIDYQDFITLLLQSTLLKWHFLIYSALRLHVGMQLFCWNMPQPPQLQFSSVQCKTKYVATTKDCTTTFKVMLED